MKHLYRILLLSSSVLSVRNQAPDDINPVHTYKSHMQTHENYPPNFRQTDPRDYYRSPQISNNRDVSELHKLFDNTSHESYNQLPREIPQSNMGIYDNTVPQQIDANRDFAKQSKNYQQNLRISPNSYREVPSPNYNKPDSFGPRTMPQPYDGNGPGRSYDNDKLSLREPIMQHANYNMPPNSYRNPEISYTKQGQPVHQYDHNLQYEMTQFDSEKTLHNQNYYHNIPNFFRTKSESQPDNPILRSNSNDVRAINDGNASPPGPETSRHIPQDYDRSMSYRQEQSFQDNKPSDNWRSPGIDRHSYYNNHSNDYAQRIPSKHEVIGRFYYNNDMPRDYVKPPPDYRQRMEHVHEIRYNEPPLEGKSPYMPLDDRRSQPPIAPQNYGYINNREKSQSDPNRPISEQLDEGMPRHYDTLLPPGQERSMQQHYDSYLPRNHDGSLPSPEGYGTQQYDPHVPLNNPDQERSIPQDFKADMPQNFDRSLPGQERLFPPGQERLPPGQKRSFPREYNASIPQNFDRSLPPGQERSLRREYNDNMPQNVYRSLPPVSEGPPRQHNDNHFNYNREAPPEPARPGEQQYYGNIPRNFDSRFRPSEEKQISQQYNVHRDFDRRMHSEPKRPVQYAINVPQNYERPPQPGPGRPDYQQYEHNMPPNYNRAGPVPENLVLPQFDTNMPPNYDRSFRHDLERPIEDQYNYNRARPPGPERLIPQRYDPIGPPVFNRPHLLIPEGQIRNQYDTHIPQNYDRNPSEQKIPDIQQFDNRRDSPNQQVLKNSNNKSMPLAAYETSTNENNATYNMMQNQRRNDNEQVPMKQKSVSYYNPAKARLNRKENELKQDTSSKHSSSKKYMRSKVSSHKYEKNKAIGFRTANPDGVNSVNPKATSKRKQMKILRKHNTRKKSDQSTSATSDMSQDYYDFMSNNSKFEDITPFHNTSTKQLDKIIEKQREYDYTAPNNQILLVDKTLNRNPMSDRKWMTAYNRQNAWRYNDRVHPKKYGINPNYEYSEKYMQPSLHDIKNRESYSRNHENYKSPYIQERYGSNFNNYYVPSNLLRQNLYQKYDKYRNNDLAYGQPKTPMIQAMTIEKKPHTHIEMSQDSLRKESENTKKKYQSWRLQNIKRSVSSYSQKYPDISKRSQSASGLYKKSNLKLRYGEAAVPAPFSRQNDQNFKLKDKNTPSFIPMVHEFASKKDDLDLQTPAEKKQKKIRKKAQHAVNKYTKNWSQIDSFCDCEGDKPINWCGCSRSCKDSIKGWYFDDFSRLYQRQRSLAGIWRCRWRKFVHDNSWFLRETFYNIFGRFRGKIPPLTTTTPTPTTHQPHGWRAASGGKIPLGAFQAGLSADRTVLFVIRAKPNDKEGLIPGMLADGETCGRIDVDGTEQCITNYEVLVGHYIWFYVDEDNQSAYRFHVDRVNGGYYKFALSICRVPTPKQYIITYLDPNYGCHIAKKYRDELKGLIYKRYDFYLLLD